MRTPRTLSLLLPPPAEARPSRSGPSWLGRRVGWLLSKRGLVGAGLWALVAVAALGAFELASFLRRDVPVEHEGAAEHFKYGSIGAERGLGIPRPIFEVLPALFEDLLPPGPGSGYERFGFLYEPGRALPIGTSVRERPIPLVGLNCAACHTGTLRKSPDAAPELLLGAPANRFDSGAFLQFLSEVGSDPRFEPGRLFAAMRRRDLALSWPERLGYRLVVIPRVKARLARLRRELGWLQRRPAFGPGRGDAFTPYKVLFGMDLAKDDFSGSADYPPLYNLRMREGMSLHWDGSNDSREECYQSAALGAGAEPAALDLPAVERVARWALDLQPPVFPRDRIDLARAERGWATWQRECAGCHAAGGQRVGWVTPLTDVGTDPERLASFSDALVARMNAFGGGPPWPFSRFKKTGGYANAPLDGIWVRSPYLHNGSVPTLRALLFPEERPEVFFRGYDAYDWERVGYVSSGPAAEEAGFRYDARLRGNRNTGHLYGTRLPAAEKEDLLEYLKTL